MFADRDFAALPHDTNQLLGLTVLADVAVTLRDHGGADVLGRLLAPYRGQWSILNCYGGGGAQWGPISHHLARLADLAGRSAEADRLYAEATAQAVHTPLVAARIESDVAQRSARPSAPPAELSGGRRGAATPWAAVRRRWRP